MLVKCWKNGFVLVVYLLFDNVEIKCMKKVKLNMQLYIILNKIVVVL